MGSLSGPVFFSCAFVCVCLCVLQVAWLHEHRSEGCSIRAMDLAAAGGHLDVVSGVIQFTCHRRCRRLSMGRMVLTYVHGIKSMGKCAVVGGRGGWCRALRPHVRCVAQHVVRAGHVFRNVAQLREGSEITVSSQRATEINACALI